ncbi:MAG: NAD(P)H-hydrate epimerase [Planctomycetales bacterium]|nr:NAD(P)H-hydrate epimerase [Planctomycetales bacterium]
MNLPRLSRELVREVDRRAIEDFGIPGIVLMENAGRGVVDKLFQFGIQGPIVVCCGRGNNAGDGFVIARHLDLRYATVKVLLLADPAELQGDALTNYQILNRTGVPITTFANHFDEGAFARKLVGAGWIVDALLGTGANGNPRPPFDAAIRAMNEVRSRRLAVDLPSGLDCETGEAGEPTLRADHTCTFVAAKPGFFAPGAKEFTGVVHVLDIGAPRVLIESMLNR